MCYADKKSKKWEMINLKIVSVEKKEYGDEKSYNTAVLEQWKTYAEVANNNSEKRTTTNTIFISINTAIVAAIGITTDYRILYAIAGIFICILWRLEIKSYKELSSVKYHIVNEMENLLPLAPYKYEWEKLSEQKKYCKLTSIEKFIPLVYSLLFAFIIISNIKK